MVKIESLPRVSVQGRFYRMVPAAEADKLLSTEGSFENGGRYNRAGEFGALYLSDDAKTCEQEKMKQAGGQKDRIQPQVLGAIEAELGGVLDLTDGENLQKLGLTLEALTDEEDCAAARQVGAMAYNAGIYALLVHSAAGGGKDLVIFEDTLKRRDCRLRVASSDPWPA